MMRRHEPLLRLGWVVGAAAVAAGVIPAPRAQAQPEGPVVIGQREDRGGIRFDYVNAALELLAQRITDRTDAAGRGRVRDREDLIRETLEISTAGYIGRRELFDFNALGRIRLSEEFLRSESAGVNQDTFEVLSEFDTTGVLFSRSLLPITIFGRRDQTLLNRSFGGTLDASVTEFGARIDLRSDEAPMNLEYRRRVQTQDDPLSNTGFTARQHIAAFRGQWKPSERNRLVWSYTLEFVDEEGSLRPTESFTRQDANITHTMLFGAQNQHTLRSDLRFFQDTSDAEITRLRLFERLDLQHSPTLKSRFQYVLDVQDRPEFTQTLHRGSALVEHQLYESLTTIAEAGGEFLSSTDGDFTSASGFGSVDLRYRKKVPAGLIFATLDFAADYRDDSDRGGNIPVTDDAISFDPSGLAAIIRRNISSPSVVVTDTTGLIRFVENVDYRLRPLGDRLELQLIPGGDIAPGDTVLVDFLEVPDPANTTLTTSLNSSLQYRFTETALAGLSPYVRYFKQAQDRNADEGFALPESDIESIVYGVEYDRPGLSLRAQHERRDSALAPFRETLVEGQWSIRTGDVGTISLGARYDDIDRIEEDIRTRIASFTARWGGRLIDNITGDMLFIYRYEDDSAGLNSTAFEQRLNLTWRRGRTEVFLSFRNTFNDSGVSDTASQVILLGLRRSF